MKNKFFTRKFVLAQCILVQRTKIHESLQVTERYGDYYEKNVEIYAEENGAPAFGCIVGGDGRRKRQ